MSTGAQKDRAHHVSTSPQEGAVVEVKRVCSTWSSGVSAFMTSCLIGYLIMFNSVISAVSLPSNSSFTVFYILTKKHWQFFLFCYISLNFVHIFIFEEAAPTDELHDREQFSFVQTWKEKHGTEAWRQVGERRRDLCVDRKRERVPPVDRAAPSATKGPTRASRWRLKQDGLAHIYVSCAKHCGSACRLATRSRDNTLHLSACLLRVRVHS